MTGVPFLLYGQSPAWLWATGVGNTLNDEGTAICTDPTGNILVTGNFRSATISFGSITLTNSGGLCPSGCWDIFVTKYNAAGTALWSRKIGGTGDESVSTVASDGYGNVYVAGNFYSSFSVGSTMLFSNGGWDIFILKFDALGNLLWAKKEGGTGDEGVGAIKADAAGNLYVGGDFSAPITLGSNNFVCAGNSDIFLAKYNGGGSMLWSTAYGQSGNEYITGMAEGKNGNGIVLAGWFNGVSLSFDTTTLINAAANNEDMFVCRMSSTGSVLWAKSEGDYGVELANGVATDAAGNVFVTGHFNSYSLTIGPTTHFKSGSGDALLIKYDSTGQPLWSVKGGGHGSVQAYGVATDLAGSVYITGHFIGDSVSFGNTVLYNQAGSNTYDMFVASYDSVGSLRWAVKVGNFDNERTGSAGLCVDAIGYPYVTGHYNSYTVAFGPHILSNAGSLSVSDIFIAKLGLTCLAAPATPAAIAGSDTVCIGTSQTYTVTQAAGVSSYLWNVPFGWTGSSTTNTLTTTVGSGSGNITAVAVNACGSSPFQALPVLVTPLPVVGIIQIGNILSPQGVYSQYQWYLNGSPIPGATSSSHIINQPGNYYLMASDNNNCFGQSNMITVSVGISKVNGDGIRVYPTVNNGSFDISVTAQSGVPAARLVNSLGQVVPINVFRSAPLSLKVVVPACTPGVHTLELVFPSGVRYQRVIVY
jgi:hypothetical protein